MEHSISDRPMAAGPPSASNLPTFRDQVMAQWKCNERTYVSNVFWHALPRVALPLAALLWVVRRDHFERDFMLIRELGETRGAIEFQALIEQFRSETIHTGGWSRNVLRLRVSGRRLQRLRWDLR
jgi:hypothetical protein